MSFCGAGKSGLYNGSDIYINASVTPSDVAALCILLTIRPIKLHPATYKITDYDYLVMVRVKFLDESMVYIYYLYERISPDYEAYKNPLLKFTVVLQTFPG